MTMADWAAGVVEEAVRRGEHDERCEWRAGGFFLCDCRKRARLAQGFTQVPTPGELVASLRAELEELHDQVADLPHSAACISATVSAVCDCPLGDALDLILDRIDTLDVRTREVPS